MATKEYKCKVCGYIHKGDKAPDVCPVCKAPSSEFELLKRELNTNSNLYTVLYAAVMVVIVAFLLVFISSGLKERQQTNITQDAYKQILASLGVRDVENPTKEYQAIVKGDYLVQSDGTLVAYDGPFCTTYKSEFKEGRLHLFVAEINGKRFYVIPVNGLGLWGDIWGFISVNEDRETVYNTYFSHKSETPGLGGEMATLYFQERFIGKKIVDNGDVVLSVVKNGQVKNSAFQVDGLSGATITSKGIDAMLVEVLNGYKPFFNSNN